MDKEAIAKKATELRKRLGGKIFAFPLDETDPFSKYTVTVYTGETFNTYPEPLNISEAAAGIVATLEGFKEEGWDADYKRNVRFISGEAQINAPDVTMRRLKKAGTANALALQEHDKDFMPSGDGYNISARGLIKFSYLSMVNEKLPKAIEFMNEYYKLLAKRKYGKTPAAIKQEVWRMNKGDAVKWIEGTYKQYISDDMEVFNLMQNFSQGVTT